jgi:hypothetical protein
MVYELKPTFRSLLIRLLDGRFSEAGGEEIA